MKDQSEVERILLEKGYKKQVFFYAIGGGEDEDDRDIFIKDESVVFYDYSYKVWRKCHSRQTSYVNGLPSNAEVITQPDEIP